MATSVGAGAPAANPMPTRDPIGFEISGPSGGVIESGSFLDVGFNFEGSASVSWTGTTMTIAPNAKTLLDIRLGDASNAVANCVPDSREGNPRLRLANGTVVESSKSGAGAWLADGSLPAVGSTSSGDLATSNGSEHGWDFRRDVDANMKLDMGGMTAVPEREKWAPSPPQGSSASPCGAGVHDGRCHRKPPRNVSGRDVSPRLQSYPPTRHAEGLSGHSSPSKR